MSHASRGLVSHQGLSPTFCLSFCVSMALVTVAEPLFTAVISLPLGCKLGEGVDGPCHSLSMLVLGPMPACHPARQMSFPRHRDVWFCLVLRCAP